MRSLRSLPTVLVLALALAACSSSGSSTESSNGRPGIYSNRIVTSELKFPVGGMTAHQLVNQYKPQWLKKRGVTSFNNPVPIKVYLNNTGASIGSVPALKNISGYQISEIRYFDASEAQFRFGLDNVAGAILVKTK